MGLLNLCQPLSCCKENERITVKIKSNCFGKPLIIKIDNEDHEDVEQLKEMIKKFIEKKNKKVINI